MLILDLVQMFTHSLEYIPFSMNASGLTDGQTDT